MTTRSLVKDQPWSSGKARAGMVDSATVAQGQLGPHSLRALPEPLVRRGAHGDERSIRLLIGSSPDAAELDRWQITARIDGLDTPVVRASAPEQSLRLFLPFTDFPVSVELLVRNGAGELTLRFQLQPARRWTVHLVHHSHLDIGYTDPQGVVLGEHVSYLDACLDLAARTDDWPEEARFRWTVESLLSFEQWRAHRPAARVRELLDRVQAGQIELSALPFNLHTDACSTDELHELLRLARSVRQEHGVRFTSAMQTDVPGSVAALPEVLHDFGVRYLSVAHNWAGRSVPQLHGGQHLPRLFRWQAASGASVLVWLTDSPHGLAYMEGPVLGFGQSYAAVDDLLPAYLTALASNPYPYPAGSFGWQGPEVTDRRPYPWDVLHLRVQGHFADNAPPRHIMSETVRQWNDTWLYPRLRLSTNTDFFIDAESRLGEQIQTFEGDWGDWWVEGIGSGARPQALVRRAQSTITSAQSVYGLTSMLHPDTTTALAGTVEAEAGQIYRAMSLFNEHTWGAADPWGASDGGRESGDQQWHWKYAQAIAAADGAAAMLDHAVATLGATLGTGPGALASFWIANTTAGTRTAAADLFLPESQVPLDQPVQVCDGRNGASLPHRERAQTNPLHRNAGRHLRILVPDVPAFGLARVDLQLPPAGGPSAAAQGGATPPDQTVLENEHLRVQVDLARACIGSILDKATGRELVDQDAVVGFNGYVYDRYTTAPGFNHHANRSSSSEELELLGSRSLSRPAVLIERDDDDVEQSLTYEIAADGIRSGRVTLRLGRQASVLEIDNRFDKPATMAKESAYLAFPFALEQPTVHYEITGSLTGTGLAHIPGAPQHMRAVRSFVSLAESGPDSGDGASVAWVTRDAPLVEPETIALPYAPFPDSTAPRQPATLYSWVHNNLWDTNFPPQQAFEATFRYAVGVRRPAEPADADVLAIRTAEEIDHPLVAVPARDDAVADRAEHALLSLDDRRVRIVALLPCLLPDGNSGVLVRLQSLATEPVRITLRTPAPVQATLAGYLGDPIEELSPTGQDTVVQLPRLGTRAVLLQPIEPTHHNSGTTISEGAFER